MIASALRARVTDPALFKNGRHLSQETIYFLGFTLYCTRNRKSNFKVGMRTEKSRLPRSLLSLQELIRQVQHHRIGDQVSEINAALRGHYAYYGGAGTSARCSRCIGPWSVTGTGCCVAAVGPRVA